MNKQKIDTKYMVTLAMLCALLVTMSMTGIGFIPLPVIKFSINAEAMLSAVYKMLVITPPPATLPK